MNYLHGLYEILMYLYQKLEMNIKGRKQKQNNNKGIHGIIINRGRGKVERRKESLHEEKNNQQILQMIKMLQFK